MVEMEEERLRMREHVMNEVGADSFLCSKSTALLPWNVVQSQQKGMACHTECCLCWD